MIDIRTGELADILPVQFTKDPRVLALSYALKCTYQTFLEYQDQVFVYAFIDGAPEYVLDLLAVELRVRYYDNDFDIAQKRKLIRTAIQVAMKDGTLYAVDSVIRAVFGTGHATDWYDYNGEPNHFKIDLDVDGYYELDNLLAVVEAVKRKTARLDGVTMHSEHEQSIYHGMISIERVDIEIGCNELSGVDVLFLADENDNVLADEDERRLYILDTEVEAVL